MTDSSPCTSESQAQRQMPRPEISHDTWELQIQDQTNKRSVCTPLSVLDGFFRFSMQIICIHCRKFKHIEHIKEGRKNKKTTRIVEHLHISTVNISANIFQIFLCIHIPYHHVHSAVSYAFSFQQYAFGIFNSEAQI